MGVTGRNSTKMRMTEFARLVIALIFSRLKIFSKIIFILVCYNCDVEDMSQFFFYLHFSDSFGQLFQARETSPRTVNLS